MTIVLWVLGVAVVQVAVALFISKCICVGKGKYPIMSETGSNEPPKRGAEAPRTRAAIESYDDLAALLVALDPQPERAAAREREAQLAAQKTTRRPGALGPWPESSQK